MTLCPLSSTLSAWLRYSLAARYYRCRYCLLYVGGIITCSAISFYPDEETTLAAESLFTSPVVAIGLSVIGRQSSVICCKGERKRLKFRTP